MVQVEKGNPMQDLVFPGPPAHYTISHSLASLGKLTSNGLAGMEGQTGRGGNSYSAGYECTEDLKKDTLVP